ncbi:MAG: GTP-binding protein [Paludibaculum sp.]
MDDGKSTLIGRLLYDSKGVYEDQITSIRKATVNESAGTLDFALLTDGLRAEREQGITIDVAYRYFATSKRKFIIADTPGHEQYTRNMATGASTANLAVVLIDARNGVLPQSRRHAFIASLLGIHHVVVAVNKMDLMDYSERVFNRIRAEFSSFAAQLNIPDLYFIPVSALLGDNIVTKSDRMPWFDGASLLHHLETVHIASDRNLSEMRFPVQLVVRPNQQFRGYAGQVASGVLRPGDPVIVLPSGRTSRVKSIVTYEGEVTRAFPPMSVTVALEDEVDEPRKHAGSAVASTACYALHRCPPGLDGRSTARPEAAVPDQTHDSDSEGSGSIHPVSGGCEHPREAAGSGAAAQRNRHRGDRHARATVRGSVSAEPRHGQLRPGGSGVECHGGGGDGHRARSSGGRSDNARCAAFRGRPDSGGGAAAARGTPVRPDLDEWRCRGRIRRGERTVPARLSHSCYRRPDRWKRVAGTGSQSHRGRADHHLCGRFPVRSGARTSRSAD